MKKRKDSLHCLSVLKIIEAVEKQCTLTMASVIFDLLYFFLLQGCVSRSMVSRPSFPRVRVHLPDERLEEDEQV